MASQATVEEALRTAANEARVDRHAAAGAQVSFNAASLARVVGLFGENGGVDRTIKSWNVVLRESLVSAATAEAGSLAAMRQLNAAMAFFVLRDRLQGSTSRKYQATGDGQFLVVGTDEVDPLDDPWLSERNT